MRLELDLEPWNIWSPYPHKPIWIAGPCSAETEEQVLETARALKKDGRVHIFRAGVWKPRTRPNAFEGNGQIALPWLQEVKKETGLLTAIEVATASHVELALKAGIDILWIGARTTVNPFSVQEIADALKGLDIPVLVKNPISPDLNLWVGALERVNKAGIKKLVAVHRGFTNYESSGFRNSPRWEIPIQLKTACPDLCMLCDPSHITGKRKWVKDVAQKAMNMGFEGLMIETHPDPENAWSDAAQQLTPADLNTVLESIQIRSISSDNAEFNDQLAHLRRIIDSLDEELVQILAKRMKIIEQIGEYKRDNNVTIFQMQRWNEILETRSGLGQNLHLDPEFIKKIMQEIHKESILIQTEILNREASKSDF